MENKESINDIIDKLNCSIDKKVESYLHKLKSGTNWIEFSYSDIESIKLTKFNKMCGLYYLEVKFEDNFEQFTNKKSLIDKIAVDWKEGCSGKCPKINKERMGTRDIKSYKNRKWIPFYLGKSKELDNRLEEHLTGAEKGEGTYKLNLQHNNNELFKNAKYRVKIIEVKELKEDKYYWVLTRIESELREKLNPICGKQQ